MKILSLPVKCCPICSCQTLHPFSVANEHNLLICEKCRHVFFEEMPNRDVLAEHYLNEYSVSHNQISIQKSHTDYYVSHFNELKAYVASPEDFDILDFGCSYPVFLEVAKREGANVLGCDYSDEAVKYGEKLGISVISPDSLSSINQRFDVIRFSHSIEHLPDPLLTMRTVSGLLKENGIIYITQPSFPVFELRGFGSNLRDAVYPNHLHFFNPISILYLATESGLEVRTLFTHQNESAGFKQYSNFCDYEYASMFYSKLINCGNSEFGVLNNFPFYSGENFFIVLGSSNKKQKIKFFKSTILNVCASALKSIFKFGGLVDCSNERFLMASIYKKIAEIIKNRDQLNADKLIHDHVVDKSVALPVEIEPQIEIFNDFILWELPIQYVASDAVSKGDVILDIGGNTGGLAIAFSRLVGEEGKVFTFEPNPEMYPRLLKTINANSISNISVVPLAVYSKSSQLMEFYSAPTYYKAASSLLEPSAGCRVFHVLTISVDDFCLKNDIIPSFIKIDVEGAEIHVIRSMTQLLEITQIPLVIEYQAVKHPGRDDPLDHLQNLGYVFFDVNTYCQVSSYIYSGMPDLPRVNVMCIRKNSALASSYLDLTKNFFSERIANEVDALLFEGFHLEDGRYIFDIRFECPDDVVAALAIKNTFGLMAYYEADVAHLRQHSNSNIVIDIKHPQTLSVEFIKKGDYAARLNSVTITRLNFGGEYK